MCKLSDFFPVILTFLRQLPFIGNFLSLPYIRGVSYLVIDGIRAEILFTGGGSLGGLTYLRSMTLLYRYCHNTPFFTGYCLRKILGR